MREQNWEHSVPERENLLEHALVERVSEEVKSRLKQKVESYRRQRIDEAKLDSLADQLFKMALEGGSENQLEAELKQRSTDLVKSVLNG